MSLTEIVVQGTLKPDGTLELDQKPNLSPGRVEVIVKPVPSVSEPRPSLAEVLLKIQQEQKARGYVPRTKEEIDTELRELREGAEAEMQATEQLYEKCRQGRERAKGNEEKTP